MPTHHTPFHKAAAEAVAAHVAAHDPAHVGVAAADLKVETPPQKKAKPGEPPPPDLGDLAVGCFAIARARGTDPAALAREIAAAFQPSRYLASAQAAGPYVNFKVDRAEAFRWLADTALRSELVPRQHGAGKTVCIDYSSPNISKHLAYHHIRGTTLGHSLAELHRGLGYRVVGINFLGDWGTTHGMLLAAWEKWGPAEGESEPLDITELNKLYVRFNEAMKQHPELEQEGRARFKQLEEGDPAARALWQRFRDVSWAEFQNVYEILGIEFDEVRGESAYEPDIPRVMAELSGKGLVTESEGAQVVVLPEEKTPILLRKQDGTTLYATRDVAAAQYRWDNYKFDRSLYVVGREQSLHFRQLFKLLALAGHEWAARCEHVPYGHVRIGGKKTASRLGNVVLMRNVFEIMEKEVRERIAAANPERSPAEVDAIARTVGIGAVVFGNLASQREKDVDFDIEKVTSFEGDSGPYLQYAHARCASIARKVGEAVTSAEGIDFARLGNEAEWTVAKRLFDLPEVCVRAAEACEPHLLCHYLLSLAGDFARWYTLGNSDRALRVIVPDDPELQRARLALTGAVRAALATGLGFLGIGAPDWM
ncbi:MAG TPA: arginine--tRNA ligase [Kofleriaceae bacterium]|nr:arginine--tRNA ligase [Kofleriaceae bacterium]